MNLFGYLFSYIFIFSIRAVLTGYVISVLWGWFVSTTFGVANIPLASAIGLSIIFVFLTRRFDFRELEDNELNIERLKDDAASTLLKPTLILLYGYVVNLFM